MPVIVLSPVALSADQEFSLASSCFSFHCQNFFDGVEFAAFAFARVDLASVRVVEHFAATGVRTLEFRDGFSFSGCRA